MVSAVVIASAQDKPGTSQSPEDRQSQKSKLDKMKTELSLTDEQVTQIKAIYAKYKPLRKELKGDDVTEEEKAKLEAMRKSEREEVAAVLTPEQQEKFKTMKSGEKAK